MDKSISKGLELLSLKGRDDRHSKKLGIKSLPCKSSASTSPITSDIGRIFAQGYDTKLPHDYVVSMLKNHFSSCGEITDVYISVYNDNTLWHCGYIYFLGESSVDKALQLNGTDVGGWNVSVAPYPFLKHANDSALLRVEGYDTSLSEDEIKSALIEVFSSYGKIRSIIISKGYALVNIFGEDAAVKAPELNGCYFNGQTLIVELLSGLEKTIVHPRGPKVRRYCKRRQA